MKQKRLRDALTADHHFQQAGFTALLRHASWNAVPGASFSIRASRNHLCVRTTGKGHPFACETAADVPSGAIVTGEWVVFFHFWWFGNRYSFVARPTGVVARLLWTWFVTVVMGQPFLRMSAEDAGCRPVTWVSTTIAR